MAESHGISNWLTEHILTVRNVYTADECTALIHMAEHDFGFEPASVRMKSGPQMRTDIRDNERVTFTSPEIANEMWRRIRTCVPTHEDSHPIGVDPTLRFYKYSGDQRFKRHKDGVATNADGDTSKYSYLLYLNDDFDGGETMFTFVNRVNGKRSDDTLTVHPETGMALLFIHDQWHEGVPVTRGAKYVLRTDLFYHATT